MKNITLTVLLFSSRLAFSQTAIITEVQDYIGETTVQTGSYIWINQYFKKSNLGIFAYCFYQPNTKSTDSWFEVYGGPTYTFPSKKNPQDFLEVGIGFGHEKSYVSIRKSLYGLYSHTPDTTGRHIKGKLQILGIIEKGGSGYWGIGSVIYNVADLVSIGAQYQGFAGVLGPRFAISKSGFEFYINPGYNFSYKEKAVLVGLNYTFGF